VTVSINNTGTHLRIGQIGSVEGSITNMPSSISYNTRYGVPVDTLAIAFEGNYPVPASVFAKSCPTCDEIAMEIMDPYFTARYPKGWSLVACRKHASALKSDKTARDVFIGGVPESRAHSAIRYYSRRATQEAEKAAAKQDAMVDAALDLLSTELLVTSDPLSAPPSTPTSEITLLAPVPSSTPTSTPYTLSAPAPPSTPTSDNTLFPPTSTPYTLLVPSTPEAIATPPPTTTAEKDPCPICVEGTPDLTLDCGHHFCNPCLTHWQQGFSDEKLSTWVSSSAILRMCFPILEANLKSRFTCPMCRTYLQHTKQSRRKRKMHNRMSRGEHWEQGGARTRRGGVGARARRERERMEREEAEDLCDEAAFRMPVVYRK
jgi:hypothetical protein